MKPMMEPAAPLVGVDLGGRTTRRTAAACLTGRSLRIFPPEEVHARCGTSDAAFLEFLHGLSPGLVAIDAPLGLPDPTQPDYLFRPCDRAAGALSPFTLGELSARAIFLASRLAPPCIEVYPKAVLQYLGLPFRKYKQDAALQAAIIEALRARYGWVAPDLTPTDGAHALDAALCVVAAWHYRAGAYRDLNAGAGPPFIVPA